MATADFETAYALVIHNEDPRQAFEEIPDPTRDDPDAKAISGINSAAFPAAFAAIAAIPQASRGPAVKAFYRGQYWNQWVAQMDNAVSPRVVDAEVNEGQGTGVRILQRAVNSLGHAITVDGGLGPSTVGAANACDVGALTSAFEKCRVAAYAAIPGITPERLAQYVARAQE